VRESARIKHFKMCVEERGHTLPLREGTALGFPNIGKKTVERLMAMGIVIPNTPESMTCQHCGQRLPHSGKRFEK